MADQQLRGDEVGPWASRPTSLHYLRQSRGDAADREMAFKGSDAAVPLVPRSRAARSAISPSRALLYRPVLRSALSIRCSPIAMPEIWPDPDRSDPMRFTGGGGAQRNRHRFAWVPFGGGAHMCLGLHFAYMQAKCFARHFLQNLERFASGGLQAGMAMWPILKPRDGLQVTVKAV